MILIKAFITGGIICGIGQILLDKLKIVPAKLVVLYVCSGAVLSGLGIYKYIADFGGAGATVPLLGFGHVLGSGVIKEVDESGFIGIFTGGIKAASAGLCAAILFGYIFSVVFSSKAPTK